MLPEKQDIDNHLKKSRTIIFIIIVWDNSSKNQVIMIFGENDIMVNFELYIIWDIRSNRYGMFARAVVHFGQ